MKSHLLESEPGMGLSPTQMRALEALVQSATDAALKPLLATLSAARARDASLTPAIDLIGVEMEDRQARDVVLGPLKRLAENNLVSPKRQQLSAIDYARLWTLMKERGPEKTALAAKAALALRPDKPQPAAYDELCLLAATVLKSADPGGVAALWSPEERERLVRLLNLTPLLRAALPRLPDWLRDPLREHSAAIRLALMDAADIDADGGPVLLDALMVHMDEPTQVLRLISAMLDWSGDGYLAASELAELCERLLVEIDRRVQGAQTFDAGRGAEGGVAEAASVLATSRKLKEFEMMLTLNRNGPWGARVVAQKSDLLEAVEARIRDAKAAVAAALPLGGKLLAGGATPRAAPRVQGHPDATAVRRAEGLLAFLDEVHTSAAGVGFAGLRAKTIEAVNQRIESYVQDLIDRLLVAESPEADWLAAYLEASANLYGLLNGPQAAQTIRRRSAAAAAA